MAISLTLIAALGPCRELGSQGKLIWHISEDLQYFKRVTTGHPVLMGRATYDSIGRPLPGRLNLVVSHRRPPREDLPQSLLYFPSPEAALQYLQAHHEGEVFVMGGAQIYQALLPHVDTLCLTHIHAPLPQGCRPDAFFPPWEDGSWEKVWEERHACGKDFPHPFTFARYVRKQGTCKP